MADDDGDDAAAVRATLEQMQGVASAYWIDVKAKVATTWGDDASAGGVIAAAASTMTVEGILADAAAAASPPPLVTFIVYDLPNRDCNAVASNGEICCSYNDDGRCDYEAGGTCEAGLAEYESEYIAPFAALLADERYLHVPVVLVIEPDSTPNFATNLDNPSCGDTATRAAMHDGISLAVRALAAARPRGVAASSAFGVGDDDAHADGGDEGTLAIYLDAAHGGWLGWENTLADFVDLVVAMNVTHLLRGFALNVANYQPLGELCADGVDCLRGEFGEDEMPACCSDPCGLLGQWNSANNELNYARALVGAFAAAVDGFAPHVLVDTGRNGVEDAREECANWCNARGAGVGRVPSLDTADPAVIDAYHWLKTPGESDGCTQTLPSADDAWVGAGACPRYDTMCGSADSIGSRDGEPFAPEAGAWFDYQIRLLAANAALGLTPTAAPSAAPSAPTAPPSAPPSARPSATARPTARFGMACVV